MSDSNLFYLPTNQQTSEDPNRAELMLQLRTIISELNQAYINFNSALEPELIEACIFEINSLQSRYAYLLRAAKDCGLKNVDIFHFPKNKTKTGDS